MTLQLIQYIQQKTNFHNTRQVINDDNKSRSVSTKLESLEKSVKKTYIFNIKKLRSPLYLNCANVITVKLVLFAYIKIKFINLCWHLSTCGKVSVDYQTHRIVHILQLISVETKSWCSIINNRVIRCENKCHEIGEHIMVVSNTSRCL